MPGLLPSHRDGQIWGREVVTLQGLAWYTLPHHPGLPQAPEQSMMSRQAQHWDTGVTTHVSALTLTQRSGHFCLPEAPGELLVIQILCVSKSRRRSEMLMLIAVFLYLTQLI